MSASIAYQQTAFIEVKVQWEGFHHWEHAPAEVAFLRLSHRHLFHVSLQLEVYHADRELEYFMVQQRLRTRLEQLKDVMGEQGWSCERLAAALLDWVDEYYPFMVQRTRTCRVSEDGENGSMVIRQPEGRWTE